MNELRWILIGFGIVLLAGIYLWGRRGSNAAGTADDGVARSRSEPPPLHGRDSPEVRGQDEPTANAELASAPPSRSSESTVMAESMITAVRPATRIAEAARRASQVDPPTVDIDASTASAAQEAWRGRVEPTFSDATATEELPVDTESKSAAAAPTLSSSETPPPRRIERRKILALRLAAAPQRLEGAKLLEALQTESLQYGKYSVFHRLHDDGVSIFSIASMVEPGTFDLEKMPQTQFPGITLFAQLPGPVPGMHALNELVACARRLQQALGGTLQDDRGVPLTVHRVERLRQEVREFERPASAGGRGGPAAHSGIP